MLMPLKKMYFMLIWKYKCLKKTLYFIYHQYLVGLMQASYNKIIFVFTVNLL